MCIRGRGRSEGILGTQLREWPKGKSA